MDEMELLTEVVRIADAAGVEAMKHYGQHDLKVEYKEDNSPLTEADMAAHHAAVRGLLQLMPGVPVLSEETSDSSISEERANWERYWLIDPIDGTKEFIAETDEFTVNIALIENGKSVLGVVGAPAKQTMYWAANSTPAFMRDSEGKESEIKVQQPAASPLRLVGSRRHARELLQPILIDLEPMEFIPMGSSLKFCVVAEGNADIYLRLGPTSEWDTAAAQCIVERAGGSVTELNGEPLRYNQKASLRNPQFLVSGDTTQDWCQIIKSHLGDI